MKKLAFVAAAALCSAVFADDITSGIVGYNTVSISGNSYKALAVQFENVAGGSIAVSDLVTAAAPKGANTIGVGADQIWRWNTANNTWDQYFYRVQRTTTYGWCKAGETSVTTDTVPAGETIFFYRATGGSDTTLTLSGGVKEFTASAKYTVTANTYTFMASPWPVATSIAGFSSCQGAPKGANTIGVGADQIWRWNTANNTWDQYFYRVQRTTTYGWCKAGETEATTDVIPAGEGFFFYRATGGSTDTITFTFE